MQTPMLGRVPWHPALIAVAFVVLNLVETGVHPAASGRALIAAVLVALSLQLLFSLAFRNRHRGALAATAVIAVLLAWLPLRAVVIGLTRLEPVQAIIVLGLLSAVWLLASRVWRGRKRPSVRTVTRALNAFSVALAVVVLAGAVGSPLFAQLPADLGFAQRMHTPSTDHSGSDAPDIYLILLDGHPRADALTEQTGHDMSQFTGSLEARDFTVSSAAQSNYNSTEDTLASMLHMRLLSEARKDDVGALEPISAHGIRGTLNDNPAFDVLHEHGYEVVAIGPPFEHVALRNADRFVDAGYLNSFECHLIRRTAVGAAAWAISPRLVGDVRRAAVERSLDAAEDIASTESDRPRFVFVHVPVPHLPVLWDAAGQPADDPSGSDCAPPGAPSMKADPLRATFLATMDHADQLVASAAERIVATSEEAPVIVVFSDHGSHFEGPTPDRTDPRHWRDEFGVLFAAYTPGRPTLFPDGVSLVNVLPRLFNAYLGTDLRHAPDLSFWPGGQPAPRP
jgi:hypothetical protein